MFRILLEQGREGLFAPRALSLSPKKKTSLRALHAHNERTYTSGTWCAGTRRVPFVRCSSSNPKTWVMEVVDMTEVKKGGLIALVQETIKVVAVIAELIACRTRSFPSALEKSV